MRRPDRVTLGKICGVWGVHGWVRVHSYTREKRDILLFNPWYLRRGSRISAVRVVGGREHGPGLVAELEGYVDRDRSRSLIDATIDVPISALPRLSGEEFYWVQLEGLQVVTVAGQVLGTVDYLMETGANDVIVVGGDRERLLPYIDEVVKQVDLQQGRILVDWNEDF